MNNPLRQLTPIPKTGELWLEVKVDQDETQLWRWVDASMQGQFNARLKALSMLEHPLVAIPTLDRMSNGELYLVERRAQKSLSEVLEKADQE